MISDGNLSPKKKRSFFTRVVPKAKKAKVKTLKAKKMVLKGVHSHTQKDPRITCFLMSQDTAAAKASRIFGRVPWEK